MKKCSQKNLVCNILLKFFTFIILFLSLCGIASAQTKSVAVSSTSTQGISISVTLNTSPFVLDYSELQFSITTTTNGIRYTNEPCPICGGNDHIETGVNGFTIYLVDAADSTNKVKIADPTFNKYSGTWGYTSHNGDFRGTGGYKADVSSLMGKTVFIRSVVSFGHDGHNNVMYGSFTLNSVYQNSYIPVIITNPSDVAINFNEVANFLISANYVKSYQWYKNNIEILGATSNTLSFTANDYNDTGSNYYCKVTGSDGTMNSNSASLTIYDNIFPTIDLEQTAKETADYTNIIVKSTDIGSGISGYSSDGVNYQDSNIFKVTENGEITFYVKDKAGNVSSKSITINNIVANKNTIYQIQEDGNLYDPIKGTILNVSFKGSGATGGTVEVNKNREIVRAILKINNRTVVYEKNKANFAIENIEATYKDNILVFKGMNIKYYAITKTNTAPTEWIRIDTTSNIEINLEKFNLDKGIYYGWAQDSEGKISDPIEMVIE